MANARRQWLLALAVALVALAGCTPQGDEPGEAETSTADGAIRVGAFNFPESRLLAELYSQALAAEGFAVAPIIELGSRETAEPALEQGRVDVLPEYTGSALNFAERKGGAAGSDVRRTHARLVDALAPRGITVGQPAAAQNQNAFAVRRETAAEHDLRTLSDLRSVAGDLVAGGPPECPQRATCLAGLRDVYGIEFKQFLSVETPAHVADALIEGEIDVGLLFTTDASVPESGFVILEDDRSLQPAENVVPIVRTALLSEHGRAVLTGMHRVSSELTTAELVALNVRVQVDGEPPDAVAREWLDVHDITP